MQTGCHSRIRYRGVIAITAGPSPLSGYSHYTRGFVKDLLWLGHTGVDWRDLAPHLGHWHWMYVRFARWRDSDV
jgi:transposase